MCKVRRLLSKLDQLSSSNQNPTFPNPPSSSTNSNQLKWDPHQNKQVEKIAMVLIIYHYISNKYQLNFNKISFVG